MERKLISIELNEVPYEIFDYYCAQRPDSLIARTIGRCKQYTTVSPDSMPLAPWRTWSTYHRGVPETTHGIKNIGQVLSEVNHEYPAIWSLLADGGVSTGVFGPFNSYPLPDDFDKYAFYLPDTFAGDARSWPKSLESFQEFNLIMTRASGRNVQSGIDWASALGFLLRAPFIGLRPKTGVDVLRHLVDERRTPWKKIRRRSYQPVVAYDLFMHLLKKTQPAFCNVFTNHVASSMHRYWAATFPEQFDSDEMEFDDEWVARYSSEILFSMDIADDFYGRAVAFAEKHPEYRVMISSSMGQGPESSAVVKNQVTVGDLTQFMAAGGFGADEFEKRHAMEPRVAVVVAPERVDELVRYLESIRLLEWTIQPTVHEGGFVGWNVPGKNLDAGYETIYVGDEARTFSELGIAVNEVQDEAGSTAYHIPKGTLIFYDPQHEYANNHRAEVSTLDMAPFLLDLYGLSVPSYMKPPGAISAD